MLIYICEEQKPDLLILKHHLSIYAKEKMFHYNVRSFQNSAALLAQYRRFSKRPTLLFLDIDMEKKTGIDTARRLRSMGYTGGIIFTTSSTEHAVESCEADALCYLSRPYDYSGFCNAMKECKHLLRPFRQAFDYILDDKEVSVHYTDIIYFETGKRIVILHTVSGTVSFPGYLTHVISELEDIDPFLPIGRNYLINMEHTLGFLQDDLVMSNGLIVRLSHIRQRKTRSLIEQWQKKNGLKLIRSL